MTSSDASLSRGMPGSARSSAVLITGAGGEVGHGLIRALHESGRRDIVAIDLRELDPGLRALCMQTYVGDVCDAMLLGRLLANYEVREIFHLAALLSTRGEFTPETAHDVNVGGTIGLLRLAAEQARSHGTAVKFVFPSSIAVYGMPNLETKAQAERVGEDQFLQPTTMYGCNKLYCEQLGRYYSEHYRQLAKDRVENLIDFRAVRFPGLISADTVPSGGTSDYAPEMIHAAARGEAYACFVREDARIPFCTMPDAIRATLQLADAPADRLRQRSYNLSAFSPTAAEFATKVRTFEPEAVITFEPDTQRQAIVDSWPADVDDTAAREDFGFSPTHDLDRAFDDYLIPAIRRRYRGGEEI
ncbi:MAG: NAD-dependent epimerase/dehydratase family protein [Planctomycetota bacterium]